MNAIAFASPESAVPLPHKLPIKPNVSLSLYDSQNSTDSFLGHLEMESGKVYFHDLSKNKLQLEVLKKYQVRDGVLHECTNPKTDFFEITTSDEVTEIIYHGTRYSLTPEVLSLGTPSPPHSPGRHKNNVSANTSPVLIAAALVAAAVLAVVAAGKTATPTPRGSQSTPTSSQP